MSSEGDWWPWSIGGEGAAGTLYVGHQLDWGYIGHFTAVVGRDYEARTGLVAGTDLLVDSPAFALDPRPLQLPSWLRSLSPGATLYAYQLRVREDICVANATVMQLSGGAGG